MTLTGKILLITFIALGLYDLWALHYAGIDYTISRFLQNSAFDAPLVSCVFGMIIGHIFMYMKPECPVCRRRDGK